MKRQEFKKKIKPIIEECVKEMLLEEGFLSSLISEVIKGTSNNVIREAKQPEPQKNATEERKQIKRKASASRKKLLEAIGTDAFNGVNVFEGTTPMTNNKSTANPLSNLEPTDPGVDISNIPGVNLWKHLVKG
jgi:hypothetical protein